MTEEQAREKAVYFVSTILRRVHDDGFLLGRYHRIRFTVEGPPGHPYVQQIFDLPDVQAWALAYAKSLGYCLQRSHINPDKIYPPDEM